jgi:hypothetical protein
MVQSVSISVPYLFKQERKSIKKNEVFLNVSGRENPSTPHLSFPGEW